MWWGVWQLSRLISLIGSYRAQGFELVRGAMLAASTAVFHRNSCQSQSGVNQKHVNWEKPSVAFLSLCYVAMPCSSDETAMTAAFALISLAAATVWSCCFSHVPPTLISVRDGYGIHGKLRLNENVFCWKLVRWMSKVTELKSEWSSCCAKLPRGASTCFDSESLEKIKICTTYFKKKKPSYSANLGIHNKSKQFWLQETFFWEVRRHTIPNEALSCWCFGLAAHQSFKFKKKKASILSTTSL